MTEDHEKDMTLRLNSFETPLDEEPRHEQRDGERWLVVPVAAAREAVYDYPDAPGAANHEFLPEEELDAVVPRINAENGIPVVLDHPVAKGPQGLQPVSAASPDAIAGAKVGSFENARVNSTDGGPKLLGEMWLRQSERGAHGSEYHETYQALERGEDDIAVSLGYDVGELDPTPGRHNGQQFSHRQRDLDPDHLAIVLRGTARCTPSEGCSAGRANAERPAATTTDQPNTTTMTDATQTDTTDAQAATDGFATWGDIEDEYRNLDRPADVAADDPLTESRFNSWMSGMLDQVDTSDFKTLANTPSGKEKIELLGRFAERGSGKNDLDPGDWTVETAPETNGHGEPRTDGGDRENAIYRDIAPGVPEFVLDKSRRKNAVEDVPVANPEEHDTGQSADMRVLQTEPVRANADTDEGPDVPVATRGGAAATRLNASAHEHASRPHEESTETKISRVSERANAVYDRLKSEDEPLGVADLAFGSGLSKREAGNALQELSKVWLIEQANTNNAATEYQINETPQRKPH